MWDLNCCLLQLLQIAYVPQAPFIFGATVRGNVTFGLPFDEARYEDAINSASLRPDLEILTGTLPLLLHGSWHPFCT